MDNLRITLIIGVLLHHREIRTLSLKKWIRLFFRRKKWIFVLKSQWCFTWISVSGAIPVLLLAKIFGPTEKVLNTCGGITSKQNLAQGIQPNGKIKIFIKVAGRRAAKE